MLFFYGTGTSRLLSAPLPTIACTHCGTTGRLSATVFSRYVSLFWTPIFPFTKTSVTVCGHCQQTIAKLKNMPESYRLPVQQLQQQARYPVSNFAALIMFVLAIVGIFGIAFFRDPKPTTVLSDAEQPVVETGVVEGARYKTIGMTDEGIYVLAEVTRLTPDTVYFKATGPLRGPLTEASATVALRDSVPAGVPATGYPRKLWHFLVQGEGRFRRIN